MKASRVGVLQIFLLLLISKEIKGGTYSIIHPKLFHIDWDEGIVVNLHGYGNANIQVQAWLRDYPQRNEIDSEEIVGTAKSKIFFNMKASRESFPNAETISNKKVELHVRIRFLSGGHSQIDKRFLVYLTGQSDYVFVQTNRPAYRPGETVYVRAVVLDSQMLPMKTPQDTFEITVKTAERVGIYREVKKFRSFIAATYKIPDDPPLGSYFVEVKLVNKMHTSKGSAEFKVEKYVLPTYNVEIELDQSTVKPAGRIVGKFKAKYTYGEPVVGTYGIVATLHIPGKEVPFEIYTKPTNPATNRPGMLRNRNNGMADFTIPINNAIIVSEMTWDELIEAEATVTVKVYVMGKAEGIMEVDQKDGILITKTPYFIDLSQTSKYFIPEMTQNIDIVVRDVVTREPVPGVSVVLSVGDGRDDEEGRSDAKGALQIPIETRNSPQLVLTIRTDDANLDAENEAEERLTLMRHESRHGYLTMSTSRNHAAVGDAVFVRFKTRKYHPSEIFYVILSRGLILVSGKRDNLRPSAIGQIRDISEEISITRQMSPGIRVVGYFMHGNNIVSNSVSLDVDDVCVSKELTINLARNETRPGESVEITYQGQPGADIGTAAVNKGAYLLNSKGRLDRPQMFKKMTSFDMGCSIAGGRNAQDVFQEAGLAVMTSHLSTPSRPSLECSGERSRKKRGVTSSDDGLSLDNIVLKRMCYSDGRKENLANLRCDIRAERIRLFDFNEDAENMCLESFLEGCRIGEQIRNSSQFRTGKQRSTGSPRMDAGSHSANSRRSNFDEGWLWFDLKLSKDGEFTHNPLPPHSITTYDIDAISLHATEGFCVAKPAELKVFKDFFIQLYLPYSVKVMEQVQIRAAVFNYHKSRDRTITLRLKTDKELCTQGAQGKRSTVATLTVRRESSQSFTFTMIPLDVPEDEGLARIWLEADPQNDESARDEIERKLKIEPSGSEEDFSGSRPLDPLSAESQSIEFEFPNENVLPNSKKCWVYGYMSFLGPIIEFDPIAETPQNLDKSLSLPHGCGEQNMKSVGPNVFAFNYLKYIRDPTPDSRDKVKTYIIDGYTRQQGHRNNGRWSIWSHYPPTIWINAYVNKVFMHAQDVWPDMDIGPICRSLEWMVSRQRNDGAFAEAAHSRHYWINVAEGGEVALTAYVLVTLAETSVGCPDKAVNVKIMEARVKATTYLRTTVGQQTIPYTAAIVAYALALVDTWHSTTRAANQRLLNMKTEAGAEVFWRGPQRKNINIPTWRGRKQSTIDIETTAYALLTQVKIAQDIGSRVPMNTVEMINKISRWMVNQQNDRGGFQSSQTTVIGIQAMTEYAKWIHVLRPPPRNPHLHVTLTAPGTSWERGKALNLDASHEFYRKTLPVPEDVVTGTRRIQMSVRGEGRGMLSYRCVYRTTKDQEICDYNIIATTEMIGYRADDGVSEAAPGEGTNVMKLVLEISKRGGDTGMAIIDISLISGFKPVESSLENIVIQNVDGGAYDGILDRYEITNQNIILYVEKIPGESSRPLKLGFTMQQAVTVNLPSPAKIVVYDYYNPEDKCSKFYSVPDGSPMIRTSCAPSSIDVATQQTCKCAEGRCPKCRVRQEQLEKTCASRRSCWNCENCVNLRDSVCNLNYGFFIQIASVDEDSMPQFVKIRATVKEVLRSESLDKQALKNQERVFLIRKDCFDKCRDDGVKTKEGYFSTGQTYLIRGNQPIRNTMSTGEQSFDYYLDRDAVVERTLDKEKCAKYDKWTALCTTKAGRLLAHCQKKLDKIHICNNQNTMRREIYEGCD